MATIDDIGPKSISEMSDNELHDLLISIRHGRRSPEKKPKAKKAAKAATTKAKKKTQNLSASDAAELLKLLGGLDV